MQVTETLASAPEADSITPAPAFTPPVIPAVRTPEVPLMSVTAAMEYPLAQKNVAEVGSTVSKRGFGNVTTTAVTPPTHTMSVGTGEIQSRPQSPAVRNTTDMGDDLVDPNELNVCDSCR